MPSYGGLAARAATLAALLGVGAAPLDSALSPTELAAWTSLARVALNLHEAIVRE